MPPNPGYTGPDIRLLRSHNRSSGCRAWCGPPYPRELSRGSFFGKWKDCWGIPLTTVDRGLGFHICTLTLSIANRFDASGGGSLQTATFGPKYRKACLSVYRFLATLPPIRFPLGLLTLSPVVPIRFAVRLPIDSPESVP